MNIAQLLLGGGSIQPTVLNLNPMKLRPQSCETPNPKTSLTPTIHNMYNAIYLICPYYMLAGKITLNPEPKARNLKPCRPKPETLNPIDLSPKP